MAKARHFSVLAVDIEKSGARIDGQMVDGRRAMYEALRGAVEDAAIGWADCPHRDRGDGAEVLFPANVAKEDVGGPVVRGLHARLQQYNLDLGPHDIPLRLRAALHAGELEHDPYGWTGHTLVTASRLLDSRELRSVLRQADAADLALIVSGTWYETVVRHNRGGVRAATYRQVSVSVKEFDERAWIHVPGYRLPPAPEPPDSRGVPDGPSGPGGRGGPGGHGGSGTGSGSSGGVQVTAGNDVIGGYAGGDQTVIYSPNNTPRWSGR